ncbi:class I SAM-dependent methyltransferase [Nocardiopsis sp. NPDC006198]|uniref:class I SAM-dependent methyltransferase n=1 Tax=Nocardiopsis sp. NPDC006198 TaxID=3154472 RepID=UPI0033B93036
MPEPRDDGRPQGGHDEHFTLPDATSPAPVSVPNPGLYSTFLLTTAYTGVVIVGSHWPLWGVRNATIHDLYDRHMGAVHLEVGPGNSHFLRRASRRQRRQARRAHRPARTQRVDLMDYHEGPLQVGTRRLRRRYPALAVHRGDALAAWPVPEHTYNSVGMTMVVHTLPGRSLHDKVAAFVGAARALKPGGVFFGCAVAGEDDPAPISALGARVRRRYNAQDNTFHNAGDTEHQLKSVLAFAFPDAVSLRVWREGATLLWEVMA